MRRTVRVDELSELRTTAAARCFHVKASCSSAMSSTCVVVRFHLVSEVAAQRWLVSVLELCSRSKLDSPAPWHYPFKVNTSGSHRLDALPFCF